MMGKRGPKPEPTALLKLRGSRVPERRKTEPVLDVDAPTCPMWLTREAKAEWKRIVPALDAAGILARVDRGILAGCCQAWADFYKATKAVEKDGEIVRTPQGFVAKNPWVTIKNEAWARYFKATAVLGLSPSARSGLQVAPRKAKSGKGRFFKDTG